MSPHSPNDSGVSLERAALAAALRARTPAAEDAGLSPAEWGMLAFLLSEVALFSTLIVTYLNFLGADTLGPTPREALSLPLAIGNTVCLLVSSFTVHLAAKTPSAGSRPSPALWLLATILLGATFLAGTAYEWQELIRRHHLTIGRNLFGTTYYTLVGFHGLHVTIGLIVLTAMLCLGLVSKPDPAAGRRLDASSHASIELASWYWHFVDAVWVAVFTVVYVVGR